MSILAWDIEASNLNATFGIVLCVGFKNVGVKETPVVLNILDYMGKDKDIFAAEKRLLIDVSKKLLAADVWLTHYGSVGRFDLNFVQSRLLYHRLPVLPAKHPQVDTWRIARDHLKLHSNRLATVQTFLKVENEKNAIEGEEWIRAMTGDRKAMAYIVEHCRRDVLVLEEVYELIKPLMTNHPNMALINGRGKCPVCGGDHLTKRGSYVTLTRKYDRLQCQTCGAWTKSAKPTQKAT